MDRVVSHVLERLEKAKKKTSEFQVFVGFDGYEDILAKPVRTVNPEGTPEFFETISEFGEYLQKKAGKSCSLELYKLAKKPGGNAVIFARAISGMGIKTRCVGAFGYPEIREIFCFDAGNLELLSISDPGFCTALEFQDGKIMLAENNGINAIDYSLIARRLGEPSLYRLMDEADVVALMNWSEMPQATDIWKGIQEHILEKFPRSTRKKVFVDISDCSRRTLEEIREMLAMLKGFSDYCEVTLSLNQNEFDRVYEASGKTGCRDTESIGMYLCEEIDLKYLVLHQIEGAVVFTANTYSFLPNHKIDHPQISTGGGDNFNAGLVFGMMAGMEINASVYLANIVSSYYVLYGRSPTIGEMISYICEKERINGES